MTTAAKRAFAVPWRDLARWDIKSARAAIFRSANPSFRPLREFVEEATELVRPFDRPDKKWPVYGVNNTGGVFFNHNQLGAEFNAPYKRIRKDWFFHNPTRANVGSLGRVPDVPPDAITSPEYQVWRIKGAVSPAFIEVLIQTRFFLDQVSFHRVGAVKERLFVENLLEIPIPVLSAPAQEAIVGRWQAAQQKAMEILQRADQMAAAVPERLYALLGVPTPRRRSKPQRTLVVPWSDLQRWSFNFLSRKRQGMAGFSTSRYPIAPLRELLSETANGHSIKPVMGPTSYKILKLSALTPFGLNTAETKYVPASDEVARRFCLRKDDLLLCRSSGSYDQVAKCGVVQEDAPHILFPDIMIRVRLREALLPAYAREVIQSPLGRSFFQSNARTAVGMWKIGADDIESFPMPHPPKEAQEEIVAEIGALQEKALRLRCAADEQVRRAKDEVEAMILERAS